MDTLYVMTRVITFTGAQGTGKTATRGELVRWLQKHKYSVIDKYSGVRRSIARDAKRFGFTINERTNFESQYYIANKYIVADIETRKNAELRNIDFIVLDRSVLDSIPYIMVAASITMDQKEILRTMLIDHFALFPSRLFYCEPLDFVTWDEDRSADTKFQDSVDAEFRNILTKASQYSNTFILKRGSVEQRLYDIIKELGI